MPARALLVAVSALAGLAVACSPDPTVTGPPIPGTADVAPDARPTRTLVPSPPASAVPPPGSTPGTDGGPLARPKATIDTFTMPSRITCHGTVDVAIDATYRTIGATAVIFVVDGVTVAAGGSSGTVVGSGSAPRADAPTSGTYAVPLPCDGNAHTVVLTAVDAQGRTTIESRAILTDTTPAGD